MYCHLCRNKESPYVWLPVVRCAAPSNCPRNGHQSPRDLAEGRAESLQFSSQRVTIGYSQYEARSKDGWLLTDNASDNHDVQR